MTITVPPRIFATVTGATAHLIAPDGRTEALTPDHAGDDIRRTVIRRAADEARRTGHRVELVTHGDRGEHHLLVSADGTLTPAPHLTTPDDPDLDLPALDDPDPEPAESGLADTVPAESPPPQTEEEPGARERVSFIRPARTPVDAATTGWRGVLARAGFHVPSSSTEQARAAATAVVSRHWAGCRTIAVVNGKGGVGKTLTTAMLAAVYGRHGGGNVLAWDNNDTRGTLGWRTETGLYDTTVRDLLPATPALLDTNAGMSDIAQYVHHQAADRYDVLRSNPELLAADQRLTHVEFDQLMRVAARYFRLVIFDSGNDESADRWLRMIDSSYQLVIPTLTAPESAESAALLLDALRGRDEHSARLAANAVVIVTQSEPTGRVTAHRIAEGFAPHVRRVVTIPYDPALKAGPLRFDTLRKPTADAWLTAAAATADTL